MAAPTQALLTALRIDLPGSWDEWKKNDPDSGKAIEQMQDTLNGLAPTAQQQLLGNLTQNVQQYSQMGLAGPFSLLATGSASRELSADDLKKLAGGLHQSAQGAPPTPAAAQQQAQAAQQSLVSQYGVTPAPFGVSPGPTGPPSAADWQTMTQMLGGDAQQSYNDYVTNITLAQQRATQTAVANDRPPPHPPVVQSAGQWFAQQQQNLQGPWSPLISAFDAQYQLQTGQQMPLALQGQLLEQINKLAPNMRNELLAQIPSIKSIVDQYTKNPSNSDAAQNAAGTLALVGATSSSPAGPGSSLYNSFYQYIQAAPPQQQEANKALQQNISSWISLTGKAPTQEEIAAITGMDYTTLQRYIDAQPSPLPNMTNATYNAAVTNTKQLFLDKMGREPTNQELTKFGGWSKDDISRWVESQPSKDNPDMTIGQRDSYLSLADKVSNAWWGGPADSRIVDALGRQFGVGDTGAKAATDTLATPAGSKVKP